MWWIACLAGYTISIAGAQGRLGRELVAQSIERGWDVQGVVRRPDDGVPAPVRTGWLEEQAGGPPPPRSLTTFPALI